MLVVLVGLRGRVERQLAEHASHRLRVLLFEPAGVVAEGVLTLVVAVLGNLVDEEQRQDLDPLGVELAFLVEV